MRRGSGGSPVPPLAFPAASPRNAVVYTGYRSSRIAPAQQPIFQHYPAEPYSGSAEGGSSGGSGRDPSGVGFVAGMGLAQLGGGGMAGGGGGGGAPAPSSAWVPSGSMMSPLGPRAMYLRSMPSSRMPVASSPHPDTGAASAAQAQQLQMQMHMQPLQQHWQQQQAPSDSLLRKSSRDSNISISSQEGPTGAPLSGSEPLSSSDSPRRNISWADDRGFSLEEVRYSDCLHHTKTWPVEEDGKCAPFCCIS